MILRAHLSVTRDQIEKVFVDIVQKLIDVGFTEFLLYYPFNAEQLPMFEKIAREVIPELKEKYNG